MNVTSCFYSVSFIEHLTEAMSWGPAVPSPKPGWGTDAEAGATVCRDAIPDEYSSPLSPSDSAGVEGLCTLSLDTPKKKVKVVSESVLCDHEERLKKRSGKGSRSSASSQVSLWWKSH